MRDSEKGPAGIGMGEAGALAAPLVGTGSAAGDNPVRGILLMIAAMMVVPFMDAIAKHLSDSYALSQIVWSRFFFHFAILAPIVLCRYRLEAMRPRQPVLQIVRGGFLLVTTVFFFAAISVMPIANALALLFVSPMVVTALSPFLLGEHVGIRRWSAVVVGFGGALIILRPGFGIAHWGSLLALGAGFSYALYTVATRKLARSAPPLVTLAYTAILGAAVMSIAVVPDWTAPPPGDLAMMVAIGAIAAVGHFLLIRALDHAPASLLAPYSYSEIVMATALGYVWFADFPDGWTWTGIAVIVASGIYISIRGRTREISRPRNPAIASPTAAG